MKSPSHGGRSLRLQPHYLARPRRIPAALLLGFAVMAGGYYLALRLAYGLEAGTLALARAPSGPSYLSDDLHAVLHRSVAAVLIAPTIWSLIHYYGRRGPLMAAAYALGAGWIGYQTVARDAGPLDHLGQFLAYAVPLWAALMLMWRVTYLRLLGPPRPAPGRRPALRLIR